MKRLVNYIKNLFGADVRLRKWCAEMTREWVNAESYNCTQALYDWVTRGKSPEQNQPNQGSITPNNDLRASRRKHVTIG